MAKKMGKIGQIGVCIVAFIVASIGIDLLNAMLLGDNIIGLYLLANFPGATGQTFLDRYMSYLMIDTLGWLTYVFVGASQNLETVSSVYIPSLMMVESMTPDTLTGLLGGLLKLVVPLIIVGIVAGLVATSKKWALLNAVISLALVGVVGVVLNVVHVQLNWISASWKFDALLQLNPLFLVIQPNEILWYTLTISGAIMTFALINGFIMGIVAVGVARKK